MLVGEVEVCLEIVGGESVSVRGCDGVGNSEVQSSLSVHTNNATTTTTTQHANVK